MTAAVLQVCSVVIITTVDVVWRGFVPFRVSNYSTLFSARAIKQMHSPHKWASERACRAKIILLRSISRFCTHVYPVYCVGNTDGYMKNVVISWASSRLGGLTLTKQKLFLSFFTFLLSFLCQSFSPFLGLFSRLSTNDAMQAKARACLGLFMASV